MTKNAGTNIDKNFRYSNKYNNSEREMTGRKRVFGKKVFLTKSVL